MRICIVLALIATCTATRGTSAQSAQREESAIRAARARSNRAIAAQDVDGIVGLLHSKYLGVSSTNARSIGPDANRAAYVQLFASRPALRFVRTPATITVNTAWHQAGERGRWTGSWTAADGPVRVGGEYYAKWFKTGAEWRILAETFVQTMCTGGVYCRTAPTP